MRTVAPSVTPVSLDEAKAHLRVTGAAEDTLISGLIDAVTGHLDGWSGILGRALVTQSWRRDFSDFPAGDWLRLPLTPVTAVSVDYYDEGGVQQTLSSSLYRLHVDAIGPYISLVDGEAWPAADTRDDAVQVTAVCGYGSAGSDIPQAIRQAMLLAIAHFYEHRESVVVGTIATQLPMAVSALLAPYRRVGLG